MAKPWSMTLGDIRLTTGPSESAERPSEETPFRMLLLGNFSGRTGDSPPLTGRRPILVDRDNVDDVMAKLDVQVQLPAGPFGPAPLTLRFREIDDFHPDRLFERLEMFEDKAWWVTPASTSPGAYGSLRFSADSRQQRRDTPGNGPAGLTLPG